MKLNSLFIFSITAFAILGVGLLVYSAIESGNLPWLIVGVLALCAVGAGLTAFAIRQYERWTKARVDALGMEYSHVEAMAKLGYLPSNGRYRPLQLPEPQSDVPVSLHGITAEQLAEFKIHAVNLLALSKQEMGDNSQQVIPHYRAKQNDYFRDVAVWTNAVRYLIANQIAYERYKEGRTGKRKEGTFLIAGTVANAYDRLRVA